MSWTETKWVSKLWGSKCQSETALQFGLWAIGNEGEEKKQGEQEGGMGLCFSEHFITAPHANANTAQHCSDHTPETQLAHAARTAGTVVPPELEKNEKRKNCDADICLGSLCACGLAYISFYD